MAEEAEDNLEENYFSIDDLLAEQELVPVVFQTDVHFADQFFPPVQAIFTSSQSQASSSQMSQEDMNVADQQQPSSSQESTYSQMSTTSSNADSLIGQRIKKNQRMYLPMWLAIALVRTGNVLVDMPKCFKDSLGTLDADPASCNLRSLNKYFFIYGSMVAELLTDAGSSQRLQTEGEKMGQILTTAFKKRFVKLLNEANSSNYSKTDYSEVTRRLTYTELLIFEAAREGFEDFNSYRKTAGYDQLNSSTRATMYSSSATSDSFNAKDFYQRTRQLEEEHLDQQERFRKRALLNDGTVTRK